MLTIGLTGGIGSGKSTVADLFRELGVPVYDTDVMARQLVEPGEPALEEIVNEFGNNILDETGNLDRQQLKEGYVKDGYKSDKISHLVQFFQVITIDEDKLTYVAYTATGKEYDRIVIVKDFESGEKKFYKKNEDPK